MPRLSTVATLPRKPRLMSVGSFTGADERTLRAVSGPHMSAKVRWRPPIGHIFPC